MKHLFIVLFLTVSSIMVSAQELAFLRSENRMALRFNYEEASINGYEESNILSFEKDWLVDQPKLIQKFLQSYNASGIMPVVGMFESVSYTLEVRPVVISDHGNITFYALVLDDEDKVLCKTNMLNAKGGRFGSFLNLVGDGMRNSGKLLAGEIYKLMNKKSKKTKLSRTNDDIYN